MFDLKIIKSKNKSNNIKVLFFHGFGTLCDRYNFTEWDNIIDKPYKDGTIRTNNWLNGLLDVFNASELIYYNRNEENCFYPKNKKLSKAPDFHNHIIKLHKKLYTKKIFTSKTKIYLIGHSVGCIYMLNYAMMFPENIKNMIFVDSLPLIPKVIKKYSNKKYKLSDSKIKLLVNKRKFTENEKNKWFHYILWDIMKHTCNMKLTNIKLLCFWNVDSNYKYSKEFGILLKKQFSKKTKNIEFIKRDHFLNETDDIKINRYIKKFIK